MDNLIQEHIAVVRKLDVIKIKQIINKIITAYWNGNKVILFGNGGSAVDAEHFVTELVSKFKMNRYGLDALALSSNVATITAIGNDFSFNEVYSRQVKAYAKSGDIVIGISTSGTSPNVIEGLNMAIQCGAEPILITGNKVTCDDYMVLNIDSNNTARIQEAYMLAIHMICEEVEMKIFG